MRLLPAVVAVLAVLGVSAPATPAQDGRGGREAGPDALWDAYPLEAGPRPEEVPARDGEGGVELVTFRREAPRDSSGVVMLATALGGAGFLLGGGGLILARRGIGSAGARPVSGRRL